MEQKSIDWSEVRKGFPACERNAYFTTAAVGPLHNKVFEARSEHLRMMHEVGDFHWTKSVELLEETRSLVGELIKASPEDIGFGYNTSHNLNGVAYMLKSVSPKKEIISLEDEFPSSVLPFRGAGFDVKLVPSKNSEIEVEDILNQLNSNTAAVVCSHVQFSSGYKLNICLLGQKLKELGVPFIINATQSLGVFPVSVKASRATALVASCHKWMNAGYGCSILYLDPLFRSQTDWPFKGWLSAEDPGAMDVLCSDFKKSTAMIETGIPPFNVLAGLNASLHHILDLGVTNIARRILDLTGQLNDSLVSSGIEILSTRDDNNDLELTCNSGTISIRAKDPEKVVDELEEGNIFVSARKGSVRLATSYYNNENDLSRLVSALRELKNFL